MYNQILAKNLHVDVGDKIGYIRKLRKKKKENTAHNLITFD
jgi:hypothetical protein